MFKEKKPAKKRERVSSLDNTFRIASILQKSIKSGRSSYVEMSRVNQIVSFNMKSRLDSLKSKSISGNYHDILALFRHLSFCYESAITPNGSIKIKDLNRMLNYDSEIVIQLDNFKKLSNCNNNKATDLDYIKNLKDLIKEREDFMKSIRA
ncbi:MAG TPA: hypothetical protein VH796_05805 [Nitrososphaeraceae archaeon]